MIMQHRLSAMATAIAFTALIALPALAAVPVKEASTVQAQAKEMASSTKAAAPDITSVNINTATAEQLQSLKGIGVAKAKAIIDYRTQNGKFKSIDDLANVSGIGAKLIEDNRHLIEL
ncbi:ComEA family DNA-binding protein [Shewanella acanthi]|uniref:ComEA family DNA-binding protein n=1 Tax=Shewanella acanthi TaxID=2864212 RepID=UPI001C65B9BE|nr:ComEA family DNA-binding protein [Shewanella acanthi]QYJ77698.1 ComEA family DNA-binding protein [Shewanella acanthi]